MATVNVTYNGRSADLPIDIGPSASDAGLKQLAAELIASGEVPQLPYYDFSLRSLRNYVVDRFRSGRGQRIYLRPKVPFGSRESGGS